MSNLTDKSCFKVNVLDKMMQMDTAKCMKLFSDKNLGLDTSFCANKRNSSGFIDVLPRHSSLNSRVDHLFKDPNFDSLRANKPTKSTKSPERRVQTRKMKNDSKSGQQSKMSLIPRPSFINSRKSLHGSRSTQLHARKELIKKMVFLAECALKENTEIKQSTPVKMLAGLTPKKTPQSGGYFLLPEFKKKMPKLEDIRSPIQDFIKRELFGYTEKPTPLVEKINKISSVKPNKKDISGFIGTPKEEVKTEIKNSSDRSTRFAAILHHCKTYNAEVSLIYQKLKILDDSFEKKLNNLPDYKIYNEFCFYQSRKEEIYKEIQKHEIDLRNFISTQTKIGCKLKAYVKKKQELFEKQINFQKNFEQAVSAALESCGEKEKEKRTEEVKPKMETPMLRRSVRLSKIRKGKFEERTPMTKKLKKLDNKSKAIQKNGKVRLP